MNDIAKKALMEAVVGGSLIQVKSAFKKDFRRGDESYFDYELLQAAFKRSDTYIIYYLLYKTNCRLNDPTKVEGEETPLHYAAKLSNPYIIKKLLNKGALIFAKDENGDTPLLAAFKNNNHVAVRAILTYSKPNCKPEDEDAMMHFHIACVTNHVRAAVRYLKCGLDPNRLICLDSKEYSGLNPVHFTAENDYYPLFQELLRHGADLSIKNPKGLTPLHIIFYKYTPNCVKCRIKQIFEIGNETKFINVEDSNKVSHLHLCCILNNPKLVQVFINNGENLNRSISLDCPINPGFTPLHIAIANYSFRLVELLLKNGADCNKVDKEGKTPLHFACKITQNLREQIIEILLHYKSCPDTVDKQGSTPLHVEFYNKLCRNKIIDILLSKMSSKINLTNNEGLSLFHIACTTNNIERVRKFINSGVNVNSSVSSGIYSGYSALHFAALNNQKDIVELLLENNADVNMITKEFQVTPLHLACEFNYAKFHGKKPNHKLGNSESHPVNSESTVNRRNQLDIINLLISHGADVNATANQGITPLLHTCMIDKNYCKLKWSFSFYSSIINSGIHREISSRMKEIVEILISNKAKLNVRSSKHETLLHIISKYSSLENTEELIKLILRKGLDIDSVDDAGCTPLHVAVKAKNTGMVKILVEHKANVNLKCKNSKIPLQNLFSTDPLTHPTWLEIFSTLLENGTDVNIIVGEANKVLLQVAIEKRLNFMVKKLLRNGANINAKDSLGNSCISSLLQWNVREDLWPQPLEFAKVFQIVYMHVQKLLALGLHVSDDVQKICHKLYPHHTAVLMHHTAGRHYQMDLINLDNIFLNCSKEVEKLKLTKINHNTSLYNILLKGEHNLSKGIINENFKKIIDQENNFPLYNDLLKLQYRRGSIRNVLLPIAKQALSSLLNICSIYLPDLCCDTIVKNLKIKDLDNLKAAIPSKRFLKRKLEESSSTTFLSSKRKRKTEE